MKVLIRFVSLYLFLFTINNFAQEDNSDTQKKLMGVSPTTVISVSVGGEFFINGTFTALINERLDHFLSRVLLSALESDKGSNKKDKDNSNSNGNSNGESEMEKKIRMTHKRNITLIRATGEKLILDLEKYYLTGDLFQNPYLKQDDVIIFPKINLETNYIVVDGAVNKRLRFPYIQGDKISDAILFARGIDPAYKNVSYAEIVRISYDG